MPYHVRFVSYANYVKFGYKRKIFLIS